MKSVTEKALIIFFGFVLIGGILAFGSFLVVDIINDVANLVPLHYIAINAILLNLLWIAGIGTFITMFRSCKK